MSFCNSLGLIFISLNARPNLRSSSLPRFADIVPVLRIGRYSDQKISRNLISDQKKNMLSERGNTDQKTHTLYSVILVRKYLGRENKSVPKGNGKFLMTEN